MRVSGEQEAAMGRGAPGCCSDRCGQGGFAERTGGRKTIWKVGDSDSGMRF